MNTKTINQTMGTTEWALLGALAIIWAGSLYSVGVAVRELPALTIVVARVVLGALGLWAFVLVTGIKVPMTRKVWLAFLGMGLLNNAIPFTLIVWGQHHIASGLASILNATTPLFTVLVANLLTRDERINPGKLVGVLIGICGVAWMIGGAAIAGLGSAALAQLAICGAAISYAFASVWGRRFREMGVAPIATATGQVTCSSALLLPVMLVVDRPWTLPMPGSATIAAIIALALVCTSLAYILYFRILQTAGATNVALVTFLIPPVAILLGIAFLDEVLQLRHMVGMALIAIGLCLIDGRLLARFKT
jgi:drug/metabolite transporter (DMT)-like permease